MSSDASNKLTKYVSATTIVTSDVANMWYGGLYGSSDAGSYDVDEPLVAGHMHDGTHADGHAQKIHLENHVTDQLEHANLGTNSVEIRNVTPYPETGYIGNAIPHWSVDADGKKWYRLDLSMSHLGAFKEIENPAGDYSEANHIRTTSDDYTADGWDFLFGSSSLEESGAEGSHRMFFDRSKGALRAGICGGPQWNDPVRGFLSVAFGADNAAIGSASSILGGSNSSCEQPTSSIVGGADNQIMKYSSSDEFSLIVGGQSNIIQGGTYLFMGTGRDNFIGGGSHYSSIVGGGGQGPGTSAPYGVSQNIMGAECSFCFIGGGTGSYIDGGTNGASVIGGYGNSVGHGEHCSTVLGGKSNSIVPPAGTGYSRVGHNVIGTGLRNQIGGFYDSTASVWSAYYLGAGSYSGIDSGVQNELEGEYCFIGGGMDNTVVNTDSQKFTEEIKEKDLLGCSILGGRDCRIEKKNWREGGYMNISGGRGNAIYSSEFSSIPGGFKNSIDGMALVHDMSAFLLSVGLANPTWFNTDLTTRFNTVIGGGKNKVDYNIEEFLVPGDPGTSFGIKLGSVAQHSIAHGHAGRAYIYNQIAHGGGYWESDSDDMPDPYGQRQTSVIVVSTEITGGSDKLNDDSQILTPSGHPYMNPDPELPADGLIMYTSNFYSRAITIPPNTAVTAKLTWIAMWRHPSLVEPQAVSGEIWGVFTMTDAGSPAAVVRQGRTDRSTPSGLSGNPAGPAFPGFNDDSRFEPLVLIPGVGHGVVMPRIRLDFQNPDTGAYEDNDYTAYPIRVSGRLEWTQVYMPPLPPG